MLFFHCQCKIKNNPEQTSKWLKVEQDFDNSSIIMIRLEFSNDNFLT